MPMPNFVPFIQAPGVDGEKVPVILRWQDLPSNVAYITAPEHEENQRKEKKSKAKGKKKGKAKGKGNNNQQAEMNAPEGPPLFNYVILDDLFKACKMCPNPDQHRSVYCSKLTPELNEHLCGVRGRVERKFVDPADVECDLCLKKGHMWSLCPYQSVYPPGAALGPLAEIVCVCCCRVMPPDHLGVPGLDWKARAVLKCDPKSPRGKQLLMEHELARKVVSDGTNNNAATDE